MCVCLSASAGGCVRLHDSRVWHSLTIQFHTCECGPRTCGRERAHAFKSLSLVDASAPYVVVNYQF